MSIIPSPVIREHEIRGRTTAPRARPAASRGPAKAAAVIRYGFWAYFLLLIFEGALRKWALPGLSTPLLVVRDPIAVAVLVVAYRCGLGPRSPYATLSMLLGVASFVAAVTMGHGSLLVAAYGARPLLVHLPFAFVVGQVLSRGEALKVGRVTILIAIPMAVLVGLQFYSPQSAWVNQGVGGDLEGAGFSGAMGYMRPPGTFSFTDGATAYFSLAAAFIGYFWLEPACIDRRLLLIGTAALMLAAPLSISRALLFQVAIVGAFSVFAVLQSRRHQKRAAGAVFGVGMAAAVVGVSPVFQHASGVLSARLESAARSEGGLHGTLVDRFLGGLVGAVANAPGQDLVGQGIGYGTNVGAVYATGARTFLIAEGEWARTVGEVGPILGLAIIALRTSLSLGLLRDAYRRLRHGDALPWMVMSVGLLCIAQGGWAQPTPLGYFTVILCLALISARSTGAGQDPGHRVRAVA